MIDIVAIHTTSAAGSVFSETKYLSFDILGRVTSSQQITDGMTINPQTYVYHLSGALDDHTYKIPAVEDGGIFVTHDAVVGKGCE
jgi:hypothetical protein